MFHVESCHSDICCIKAMTLSPSGHQIPISLFGSHRLLSSPRHSTSLSFWTTLLCVADMLARGHLAVVDRQSSWCQTLTSCHCWWLFWSYFGRQSVIPRHYFLQNSNQSLRRSSFAELSMALYLSKNLSEQELSMAQYLGVFLNKSSPWHCTSVSFWTRAFHGTVPWYLSEQLCYIADMPANIVDDHSSCWWPLVCHSRSHDLEQSSWWCYVCHIFTNISSKTKKHSYCGSHSYPDIILQLFAVMRYSGPCCFYLGHYK